MPRLAAAVSVALLALSAGCTIGPGGTPSESAPPPASIPASAPASSPASAPASASSAPASPTSAAPASPSSSSSPSASAGSAAPTPADPNQPGGNELGQVVATRTSAIRDARVVLKVYPVVRDGTTSQLNFTVEGGDRVQLAQTFSDGNFDAIEHTGFAVDGIQLIDGKNAKAYLVASDGKGQCLCSRGLQNVFLFEGTPTILSATFAAPPADVTAVDVRIPLFGTVPRVPVQ